MKRINDFGIFKNAPTFKREKDLLDREILAE